MKTMKDYLDLYLKCDVVSLADIFEKIKISLKIFGLCMSHCFSAPALSWDAVLNITKVELKFILDTDKYLLFQKGVRGGVLYITKRYCQANNKYLKSYDPKQESKYYLLRYK